MIFSDWLIKNKIKIIVFDFDDTLCKTKWVFERQLRTCASYFSHSLGGKDAEGWYRELEKNNNRLFEVFKVNPKRWVEVVNQTIGDVDQEIKDKAVEIFMKIYREPLPFIEGVEESLSELKKQKMNMAIHTHANADWTWRKYDWLRLDRFFPKDKVFISNEDDHKTADSWRKVFEFLDCPPKKGMVIGDSPRSDINPALEIGVGKCVLYQGGEIWSVHRQEILKNVRVIKNLTEMFDLGLKLFAKSDTDLAAVD